MKYFLLSLLLLMATFANASKDLEDNTTNTSLQGAVTPPPPNGRSFFLFSAIIRRFRQRWFGYPNGGPAPLFVGPTYPVQGYYNCPHAGCNTVGSASYYPAPYETPNYYHYSVPLPPPASPSTQQQQSTAQQQSNVVIYHTGHDQQGYYGQSGSPAYPPPPPIQSYPSSQMRPPGYGPIYPSPQSPPYLPTVPPAPLCGPPPYHCPGGR